jgi:hypothetical protein
VTVIAPLTAAALLELNDTIGQYAPTEKGVALLSAFVPGLSRSDALMLDVGSFHALLLDVCECQLGRTLTGRVECSSCDAALDVELELAALRQPPSLGPDAILEVSEDDGVIRFRLPRPADLLALDPGDGPQASRRTLLSRCVVEPADPPLLSEATMAAMAEIMAESAPQADVIVPIACAVCGHHWQTPLDPEAFLCGDLENRAGQLIRQVHALATVYHWSEAEILALPPARRRRYLQWVEA